MASLLEIREYLKGVYGKFDIYIVSFLKFLLTLITLFLLNGRIGFMYRLQNPALILIISLLCSFLPINIIVLVAAAFAFFNVYALSMECAVVLLVVLMLMFLLYFRFTPKDALVVLLLPVCFMLNIPYVIPVCCGLIGTPISVISCCCGSVIFYILEYVRENSSVIGNLEADSTVSKFQYIVDNILSNRAMLLMSVAFAITIVAVYFIRRLSIENSWTIAIITGIVLCDITVLVGDIAFGTAISIPGVVFGSIVSLLLAMIIQFFVFTVDYSRTEHLQFEDDEYYYYVKAVPKMTVATSEKKVKHIQSTSNRSTVSSKRVDKGADERARAVVNNASRNSSYSGGPGGTVRGSHSESGSTRSSYSGNGTGRSSYSGNGTGRSSYTGDSSSRSSYSDGNSARGSYYGSGKSNYSGDDYYTSPRRPVKSSTTASTAQKSTGSSDTRRITTTKGKY